MNIKLSVIVPCYNEERRFQRGFEHYYSYLKRQKYSWELILVNDGSCDKTLQLMQKVARARPQIKVLTHSPNRGKGFAIVVGVRASKGQYILFTDIDHSVPIETIETFYDYFDNGYSVVIGSRRVYGAKIMIRQNLLRESMGRVFTLLVRFFINWEIRDATCGFKAFERKVAKKLFQKLLIYDWAFDAEILYLCKKYQIKLAQAPVRWSDVRGTKVSLKRDVLRSFVGLLKIQLNDFQKLYQ